MMAHPPASRQTAATTAHNANPITKGIRVETAVHYTLWVSL